MPNHRHGMNHNHDMSHGHTIPTPHEHPTGAAGGGALQTRGGVAPANGSTTVSISASTGDASAGYTEYTGSGSSHNNVMPYETCFSYKRLS